MYRVDRRIHRHKRARRRLLIAIALLVVVGSIYGLVHLRISPKQQVRNSPPVSKAYNAESSKKITVSKQYFTLQLPAGWQEIGVANASVVARYSFRSAAGQARLMDLYIDGQPNNLGLNKAIVVNGSGDGVIHDVVSDNCTTYTDGSKKNPQTGLAPAKWQGIDFSCDMANFARALVGTISKDGLNHFNGTGPVHGTHQYLILYTDNNISPDYTVLYDILSSLRFK